MIDVAKIEQLAAAKLDGTDLFVVEVKISSMNEIEVLIDSDTNVGIDACVELSRAIEAEFDRETEDFELTVASAGVGQPLKFLRQYRKLIGKSVEVLLKSGIKFVAVLDDATTSSITLSMQEMVAVEGKKRKQSIEVSRTFDLSEIKQTKEHIDYK